MFRFIILLCVVTGLVFGMFQLSGASDLCCIGNIEKNVKGNCIVKGFQDGRICLEETSRECWGRSGCYQLKDLGSAGVGDRVIVTGWREGDQKCYNGPNCGKVVVVGKDSASLPPPPLPEGEQGQQQGVPTASLPAPPQQPQAQPPAQQEPQQPVTQTIDNTLDIFRKVKDLFR